MRAGRVAFLGTLAVAFVAAVRSIAACSSGSSGGPDGGADSGGDAPAIAVDLFGKTVTLNLKVAERNESPVFGAGVRVNGVVVAGTTDATGMVTIVAPVTSNVIALRTMAEGYVDNVQVIDTGGAAVINAYAPLLRVGTTQTVAAEGPATVVDSDAGRVDFPAGSFTTEDGGAVTGPVVVSVTTVPPRDVEGLGTFGVNGSPDQALQSLGALAITATSNGTPVQIAPGRTITIALPADIPADGGVPLDGGGVGLPTGTAPPPVWRQNPQVGGWDSTPTTFALQGNRWVAQVDSLATWNCDYPNRVTCVRGTATTYAGDPLGGAVITGRMQGRAAGFLPASTVLNATTGGGGTFCMEVVPGTQLSLTVACPGGGRANVGPFAASGTSGARCSGGSCSDLGTVKACCKTDADCAQGEACRQGACVTGCDNITIPQCGGSSPFCCVIERDGGCSVGPHCDSIACSNYPNEVPCRE